MNLQAKPSSRTLQLEEASFDLGAGPLSTFRQVTLPRLARAIVAGGLLAFTFSFDEFYTSLFVAGTGGTTLPMFIFASLRFGVTPAITATATSPSIGLRGEHRLLRFVDRSEPTQRRKTTPLF